MIKHIHVDECHSTQDLLKEQLNTSPESETFLISCELQNAGHGRGGKSWTYQTGSLCFSLNISPHKILSFTALEVSVLVARYFEARNRKLMLKWPNDILDEEQKKCSGILIQGKDGNMLAGIGLNIFSVLEEFGGIYSKPLTFSRKELSADIADFILNNRYQDSEVLKQDWTLRCGHIGKNIIISEADTQTHGVFIGLGDFGEARVKTEHEVVNLFNGSLRLK